MATIFRQRKGERITRRINSEVVEVSAHTRDLLGENIETCSICGNPNAAAHWLGIESISVCRPCAVEALPALIADAIVGEHGGLAPNLDIYLAKIEKAFWRAATLATQRTAKRHNEVLN